MKSFGKPAVPCRNGHHDWVEYQKELWRCATCRRESVKRYEQGRQSAQQLAGRRGGLRRQQLAKLDPVLVAFGNVAGVLAPLSNVERGRVLQATRILFELEELR